MRNQNQISQKGFTLVELMVVFTIMVLLTSAGVISWNRQKPRRSLVLTQNETTTNLRKVQGYAVSSRNLVSGAAPKYYLLRFEEGQSSYTVNAVSGANYLYTPSLETISLPQGVTLSDIVLTSYSGTDSKPKCVFVIFGAVYGKTYLYGANTCDSSIITTMQNFPDLAPYANYQLELVFAHSAGTETRSLRVYGLSGKVEAVEEVLMNGNTKTTSDRDGSGGFLGGPSVGGDSGSSSYQKK